MFGQWLQVSSICKRVPLPQLAPKRKASCLEEGNLASKANWMNMECDVLHNLRAVDWSWGLGGGLDLSEQVGWDKPDETEGKRMGARQRGRAVTDRRRAARAEELG